jgi:hypothetical protein
MVVSLTTSLTKLYVPVLKSVNQFEIKFQLKLLLLRDAESPEDINTATFKKSVF